MDAKRDRGDSELRRGPDYRLRSQSWWEGVKAPGGQAPAEGRLTADRAFASSSATASAVSGGDAPRASWPLREWAEGIGEG